MAYGGQVRAEVSSTGVDVRGMESGSGAEVAARRSRSSPRFGGKALQYEVTAEVGKTRRRDVTARWLDLCAILIGNMVGGITLVAALNHAQATSGHRSRPTVRQSQTEFSGSFGAFQIRCS